MKRPNGSSVVSLVVILLGVDSLLGVVFLSVAIFVGMRVDMTISADVLGSVGLLVLSGITSSVTNMSLSFMSPENEYIKNVLRHTFFVIVHTKLTCFYTA